MAKTREELKHLRRIQRLTGWIMTAGGVIGVCIAGFMVINTVVMLSGLYLILTDRLFI